MPRDPESRMIVARAALAARDFKAAREAMAPLIAEGQRPTARMCLIMAELEDAETGDEGQVREWLARSARAPRDPVWMADGVAAANWAPVSPVTGRLDAFVWQKPSDRLGTEIAAKDWTIKAIEPPVMEIAHTAPQLLHPPEREPELTPPALQVLEQKLPEAAASAPPAAEPPKLPRIPRAVIFPMPAPPDDPGLADAREDKDNVGLF